MRTLLADDEMLARKRLRQLLSIHSDIEVVGECASADEVSAFVKTQRVDLLFLDIQMPGGTGFDTFEAIGPAHMPLTIFVTAFDVHALKAFEVRALDYVLKPIESQRLARAIQLARDRRIQQLAALAQNHLPNVMCDSTGHNRQLSPPFRTHLLIPNAVEDVLIEADTIEWIEAADGYVCIHLRNKEYLLRETIKQCAESLDPRKFVRVHRSAIINIKQVRKIVHEGRTDIWAVLQNAHRVRMSRQGWQALLTRIGTAK